jgi:hypothetical protein
MLLAVCAVGAGAGLYARSESAGAAADNACRSELAAACGKCGDGRCVKQCGETPTSCPADCGISSDTVAEPETDGAAQ